MWYHITAKENLFGILFWASSLKTPETKVALLSTDHPKREVFIIWRKIKGDNFSFILGGSVECTVISMYRSFFLLGIRYLFWFYWIMKTWKNYKVLRMSNIWQWNLNSITINVLPIINTNTIVPLQVKCQLLNYDIFLNEFPTYIFWGIS